MGVKFSQKTFTMANKLVTSFRFSEENNYKKEKEKKKKSGLNGVFTDFIICRLTETIILKSRDLLLSDFSKGRLFGCCDGFCRVSPACDRHETVTCALLRIEIIHRQ